MKWYKKIWAYPLLLVNIAVAAVFMLCAASPLIPASQFPLISLAGLAFPFLLAAVVAFILFWLVFHKRYCLVSLLALAVCFESVRDFFPINFSRNEAPEGALKVVSYNVLSSNFMKDKMNDDNAILSYLRDSEADIICLQECNYAILRDYAKGGNWTKRYPYRSYEQSTIGITDTRGIVCLSRYPILHMEQYAFEESGNAAFRYDIDWNGDTLHVFNCHLQSYSLDDKNKGVYESIVTDPENVFLNPKELDFSGTKTLVKKLSAAAVKRKAQADILADEVKEVEGDAIIVCGDFNDSPISYAHRKMDRLLTDAHTVNAIGPGFSYNRNHLYYRIDQMFCSDDLAPYGCKVDKSVKESDHYPIYACFSPKKG